MGPSHSPIEVPPGWLSVGEMLPVYEAELISIQRGVAMYVHSYFFMTELM
jgi:hypothetical protein